MKCKYCGTKLSAAGIKKQYCDACDKSLKENMSMGSIVDEAITSSYNGVPVEQYPADPYYKVDVTNKDEKEEFDSQFKELKKFGDKMKKELESGEKSSKIYIDQSEEEEDEFENGKFR